MSLACVSGHIWKVDSHLRPEYEHFKDKVARAKLQPVNGKQLRVQEELWH